MSAPIVARSTTVTADPSRIEDGVAYVYEELWPRIRQLDGCLGLSMAVDRDSGLSIVTAAYRSLEAMRASAEAVKPMREGALEAMGVTEPPRVEEWEVVGMHRDHHTQAGAWVRSAWSHVPKHKLADAIDHWKYVVLPRIQDQDGFCSASLMINRESSRGVASVAFDSPAALEATRETADYLRGISSQEVDVEFLDVAEFELVFAHLHLPELV